MIKHEALEDRLAIDEDFTTIHCNRPEACVGRDRVVNIPGTITKRKRDVVEVGIPDIPEMNAFLRDGQNSPRAHVVCRRDACRRKLFSSIGNRGVQGHPGAVSPQRHLEVEAVVCDIRCDTRTLHRELANGFHPDRLPNSSGTGVKTSIRAIARALLATRLWAALWIPCADDNCCCFPGTRDAA